MGIDPKARIVYCCLAFVFWVWGCAQQPLVGGQQPSWVVKGSGAYDVDGGRVFHGVGKAAGISSPTLQRATADNLARDEMSQLFGAYVFALAQNASGAPSADIPEMAAALRALIQRAMEKAVISEHWADAQAQSLFALCSLQLEAFKRILNNFSPIDQQMRSAMLDQADQTHSDMR